MDAFKSEVLDFYENQIEDATNGLEQLQSVLDNLQHTVPKDKVSFIINKLSYGNKQYLKMNLIKLVFLTMITLNQHSIQLLKII